MNPKPQRLSLENIGPIKRADIEFGDLTVLVGPQATGKSIFLQWLKLVIDADAVRNEFKRFSIEWRNDLRNFLELYFGEGMSGLWRDGESNLYVEGNKVSPETYVKGQIRRKEERMFFIPAQRVMSLRDGATRPFSDYRAGDPFALREFSEKLHHLVQTEFGQKPELFPQKQRLNKEQRDPIARDIFGGFGLETNADKFQKRVVLSHPETRENLPYLVWSAGQREFVPLLLGFYWLMPPAKVPRREKLEWVVIEEMEMGLHPNAISAVLLQIMELLRRGYRVCLSTHSPHVLDVVWALRILREHGGETADFRELFSLGSSRWSNTLAEEIHEKDLKTYFFTREGAVEDISELNPGSDEESEAGWGGLSGFSGHVSEVVADVISRERVAASE